MGKTQSFTTVGSIKGQRNIFNAIGFCAISFAALALTFPKSEFSSDFRTVVINSAMSYTDGNGHSQGLGDVVSMTDALQYSMGWAERLAVDSQGRYPASDSVLALAEGLVIRHVIWMGITANLPLCAGPLAVTTLPWPQTCTARVPLGDIARQLYDATDGAFNATFAASTAKWDTWFQPLIVSRLLSSGEPRSKLLAAAAALAGSETAMALAASQLSEFGLYIVVQDVYLSNEYALLRIMS